MAKMACVSLPFLEMNTVIDAQGVYSLGRTLAVISEGCRNDALKQIFFEDYNKRLRILGQLSAKKTE